jgi:hypothetical protein
VQACATGSPCVGHGSCGRRENTPECAADKETTSQPRAIARGLCARSERRNEDEILANAGASLTEQRKITRSDQPATRKQMFLVAGDFDGLMQPESERRFRCEHDVVFSGERRAGGARASAD